MNASKAELVYYDMIRVGLGERRPGIYWLRLYTTHAEDYVAIATEVPGNPGRSVTHAMSGIVSFVTQRFQISPRRLQIYQIWPRGAPGQRRPNVKRVISATPWSDASRGEIEQLVGRKLRSLPRHKELYARVEALGGGNKRKLSRPMFEAVARVDLPAPHNLFECANAARFLEIWDSISPSEPELHDDEIGTQAGREFIRSLTVADRAVCSYHQADWKAIADESVRILHVVGRQDLHRYVAEARRSALRKSDQDWLVTLFEDPIEIGEGGYSNGQHRGCALRFSRADRAAIVVDDEILGETCDGWIYEGGG